MSPIHRDDHRWRFGEALYMHEGGAVQPRLTDQSLIIYLMQSRHSFLSPPRAHGTAAWQPRMSICHTCIMIAEDFPRRDMLQLDIDPFPVRRIPCIIHACMSPFAKASGWSRSLHGLSYFLPFAFLAPGFSFSPACKERN